MIHKLGRLSIVLPGQDLGSFLVNLQNTCIIEEEEIAIVCARLSPYINMSYPKLCILLFNKY